MRDDRVVNPTHLAVVRVGEVNCHEVALESLGDLCTATTRRPHRCHHLQVQDKQGHLFLAIVPVAVIRPGPKQFQWGLGAILVLSGHVQVVHKHHAAFIGRRSPLVRNALFQTVLNYVLGFFRRSLS